MTRQELERRLEQLGIEKSAYSLEGISGPEMYVLRREDHQWAVFYSERNYRQKLRYFSSESDACEYMLDLIMPGHQMGNNS